MADEVAVGIVGVDSPYWPTAFAGAISARSDATLAGFVTVDGREGDVESNLGSSLDEFQERYGMSRLSDLDELAAVADAVFVCTRNTSMPDAVVGALERGLDVFAAKPVAVDTTGLRHIEEHVATTDQVFTAGQTGRNHPAMAAVAELVRAGDIGDVHTVRVMHQHWRYADWAAGTWYENPDEGTACNWLGWYPIDVAVSILGAAVELKGSGRQLANDFDDQPDHLNAIVRHESGRTSSLDVYCDVGSDWDVDTIEIEVVGSDGIARYRAPEQWISVHRDGGRSKVEFEDRDTLEADVDAWLEACRGRGQPALSAEETLHVAATACTWQDALDVDGWTPTGSPSVSRVSDR